MGSGPGIGQVNATQEQLFAMANRCQDTRQNIASGMAQLVDRIQTLGGSGLRGSANNALQEVSAQLNDGLARIMNALDELSGKISDASTRFGVDDEEAATDIRAAATATGGDVVSILRG